LNGQTQQRQPGGGRQEDLEMNEEDMPHRSRL
jgi:hypothetical protein